MAKKVLGQLKQVQLTVVIGRYALDYHLSVSKKQSVTELVGNWQQHWPTVIPLPHPSTRNNRWLKNNPWFEVEVVPELKRRIADILA